MKKASPSILKRSLLGVLAEKKRRPVLCAMPVAWLACKEPGLSIRRKPPWERDPNEQRTLAIWPPPDIASLPACSVSELESSVCVRGGESDKKTTFFCESRREDGDMQVACTVGERLCLWNCTLIWFCNTTRSSYRNAPSKTIYV